MPNSSERVSSYIRSVICNSLIQLGAHCTVAHLVNDEAFLPVALFFQVINEILKLFHSRKLFLYSQISDSQVCFLVLNPNIQTSEAYIVFHIHRILLILDPVKSLSP